MKPISEDLRRRIVTVYKAGGSSYRQVAERFQVSLRSVKRFVKQGRETGTVSPKPAANGRQPSIDVQGVQYLKERLEAKNDITQQELTESLWTATGRKVSQPTRCRTLRRERLTRKKRPNGPKNRSETRSKRPVSNFKRR